MTAPTVPRDPDERAAIRTAGRYVARHYLWDNIPDSLKLRVVHCGRSARSKDGVAVQVSVEDGHRSAGYGGLQHCGSVWACPVCSAKICSHRQREIEAALVAAHAQGLRVAFATFTMRHSKGQAARSLWDALAAAWKGVTGARGWGADQGQFGFLFPRLVKSGARKGQTVREMRIPNIRLVEINEGVNGWHIHVHTLLFLGGQVRDSDALILGQSMFERWSNKLAALGLAAPSRRHGFDIRLLPRELTSIAEAMGGYFNKNVYTPAQLASMEMARGDLKAPKNGNRTPFMILAGLVDHDSGVAGAVERSAADVAEDRRLWHEYLGASKGRRQITWSPGLREFLLPDLEDQTDEEVADADHGGETVAVIDRPTWAEVIRHRADHLVLVAFRSSTGAGLDFLAYFQQLAAAGENAKAAERQALGRRISRRRR